jgi:hypothetical protein
MNDVVREKRLLNGVRRAFGKLGPNEAERLRELRATMNVFRDRIAAAGRSRLATQTLRAMQALGRGAARGIPAAARFALRMAARHPWVLALVIVVMVAAYAYSQSAVRQPPPSDICDCNRVDAGLLTKEYQHDCRDKEKPLLDKVSGCGSDVSCMKRALGLKTGPDGKLESGMFCSDISHGDFAWPLLGGPGDPPKRPPDAKACTSTSGLVRDCGH